MFHLILLHLGRDFGCLLRMHRMSKPPPIKCTVRGRLVHHGLCPGPGPGWAFHETGGGGISSLFGPLSTVSLQAVPGLGEEARRDLQWKQIAGTPESVVCEVKVGFGPWTFLVQVNSVCGLGWSCSCSNGCGHRALVRPQTNGSWWSRVTSLWGRVAPSLAYGARRRRCPQE